MGRNSLTDVDSGVEGWDAIINENNDVLGGEPLPIVQYATVGSMPGANLHDRSICAANHADIGYGLFISDGSRWIMPPVPWVICLNNATLSSATFLALKVGDYSTGSSGLPIVFPTATRIIGVAVNAIQYAGVDPGDWTIKVENLTSTLSENFSGVTFNSTLGARQQSAGKFGSSGLAVAAKQELKVDAFGPAATAGLSLGVTLWGVTYHEETWPTS